MHIVTITQIPTTSFEIIAEFGEEVVVSLNDYYWSKSEKAVVKRGSKRTRQGTIVQVSVPNQVIWKRTSTNIRREVVEKT